MTSRCMSVQPKQNIGNQVKNVTAARNRMLVFLNVARENGLWDLPDVLEKYNVPRTIFNNVIFFIHMHKSETLKGFACLGPKSMMYSLTSKLWSWCMAII